jgi:regulatory protein
MGKRIIDIVKGESRKQKVLIDGEPIYYLFSKNIKSLKLFIGKDLDDEVLVMIKDIVVKRGLSYCYHLIAKKDFTTHEINQKLSKALYDDESIEIILNKLTDMKLLDDESYTKRYLESYLAHKSKKWIEHKLYLKGIKNFDYADTMDSMEVVINAQ